MKNLKIRKKMLALAVFNMVLFTTKSNVYAGNDIVLEQTKDIMDFVEAKEEVVIKEEPASNSDIVGTLNKGNTLKLLDHIDGYYEVLYNNDIAYVRDNLVKEVKNNSTYGYLIEEAILYQNQALTNEATTIDKYQLVDILKTNKDSYLVTVNGRAGYIEKDKVDRLYNKFIVVDISDQHVTMYEDNDILLESDVVTGRPKAHSTPQGIYQIKNSSANDISKNRYLVGPGYRSYVDYMMKFTGNIGFHDAEYYVNEDGKKHGWRDSSEFGGSTYLTNGSHGCVNMPHDSAEKLYEIVEPAVKENGEQIRVLVKE